MRLLFTACMLALAACAPVSMPRQPFTDIPVPPEWELYSRESVITETPQSTTAKLIYFVKGDVDATLEQARRLLTGTGWVEKQSERFMNPQKFPGVWADFTKGEDVCRVTVIEGAYATHVDYTVARARRAQ